jgi:hypothetical protein
VDKQRRRSGDFEIDFSDVITSSHADTDAPLRESQRIKQILDSYASVSWKSAKEERRKGEEELLVSSMLNFSLF